MDNVEALVLDWSTVAGGGFVASLLFLALVERLRRTFAARAELEGVQARLAALEGRCAEWREAALAAGERAARAEREQGRERERLGDQVLRPLERLAARVEGMAEAHAAHGAALDQVVQRLDRLEGAGWTVSRRPARRG